MVYVEIVGTTRIKDLETSTLAQINIALVAVILCFNIFFLVGFRRNISITNNATSTFLNFVSKVFA